MAATQNHIEPARFDKKALLGSLWAGVAISFCFLLFRFYVRLRMFRRLHIDDPFLFAAWLMTVANAALWQRTGDQLYFVIALVSGQILLPPPDYLSQVYTYLHSQFANYVLFYTALWSVKISFLLFFRNLGNQIVRQRILWYCVLAFTIASYGVCLGMVDYKCLVGPSGSSLVECSSLHAAHYQYTSLRVATAFDIISDALIILVSTNLLWNMQVEIRKKIALIGIGSLTIFIICVSIARVVIATNGPRLDLTWVLLWGGLELTVAIIVACLASFRTLYIRSERLKRPKPIDDLPGKAARFLGNGHGIPLHIRGWNSTHITASENTGHNRQTSAASSGETILPTDSVYVRHEYSVFPDPEDNGEHYEEHRNPG